MMVAGCELRRIQNHQIKFFSGISIFSELLEDVSLNPFHLRFVKFTLSLALDLAISSASAEESINMTSSAPPFAKAREAAGIAEAIQSTHASAVNFSEGFS